MGIDDSIKELKHMKMKKPHFGAEYDALITAIRCMENQQEIQKRIAKMQTYTMFDGDIESYVNLGDLMEIIRC
jgi:hypothetical protein